MPAAIRTVKLELLRSGPAHNQLLSPLTPYIALCGPSAPQTVTMPYEHRQLLTKLARLRYQQGDHEIEAAQREAELRELGEAVGRLLGAVPGLQTALDGGARDGSALVHLRIALSALELGMVPFEAAISPDNFPGSGAPLLLRTPTVITREVRRSQPIEVQWSRPPRILFAFATPPGLRPVPAQAHLNALRRAIEPYVPLHDQPEQRLPGVRALLTVLPEASLKALAEACRTADYTHVHLLAHGAPFEEAGHRRYGVALCGEGGDVDIVDGERLAIALRGAGQQGALKAPPTLVSLATCDSGAIDSVLAPGGSIAHALHEAGIPWVVASQFPLWMSASTIAVEALYGGLLAGSDPRCVLYDLRQRLRTEVPQTHDWASIVAYAVSPWDFERQIDAFFDRQLRARLNVKFARMDALAACEPLSPVQAAEFDQLAAQIRAEHVAWIARAARQGEAATPAHAEALGMSGASEKRIAIACTLRQMAAQQAGDAARAAAALAQATHAYEAAREAYRQAVRTEPTNHWAITQFLSIVATPALMPDAAAQKQVQADFGAWWGAARQIADWQLIGASGTARAWALGTLAELELLASVYQGRSFRAAAARKRLEDLCGQIVQAAGPASFPVGSTRRQFQRYSQAWAHARWAGLAKAAVAALDRAG